jgi:hypothetical protein
LNAGTGVLAYIPSAIDIGAKTIEVKESFELDSPIFAPQNNGFFLLFLSYHMMTMMKEQSLCFLRRILGFRHC